MILRDAIYFPAVRGVVSSAASSSASENKPRTRILAHAFLANVLQAYRKGRQSQNRRAQDRRVPFDQGVPLCRAH